MERIKAPIFLEVVLAIEIMLEPQSNLEEKVNCAIQLCNSIVQFNEFNCAML